VKAGFPDARIENSLYGQCFFEQVDEQPVLFCHGGWGNFEIRDAFNEPHMPDSLARETKLTVA